MMKILVIEDNESVSAMIELFFSKEGIAGEFVKDGLTGYSRAQDTKWDCLIVDWMLPGMDGITICRTLEAARICDAHHYADRQRQRIRPGIGS